MNDGSRHDRSRRRFLAGTAVGALAAASGIEPAAAGRSRGWDLTVDVLIAGSGAAGTAAAIEARRAGLETLVLERYNVLGGSSGMSGGVCYLGGGTSLQRSLGFEDSVDAMYDYMAAAGTRHPHLDKIQVYCEGSVEHFEWLLEQGVHYSDRFTDHKGLPPDDASLYYSGNELTHPWPEVAAPAPRGHVPGYPGHTGGRHLMDTLIASAQKAGARYARRVTGERLVQEPGGRVAGMILDRNGERRRVRARRGVVLACGGFIHNEAMLRLYAPELHDCSVPWGNAGDLGMGIRMGIGAGGAAIRMHQGFAIIPLYPPHYVLSGIVVNRRAQRFVPEDSYHAFVGHEIAFNQHGQGYLITDADSSYRYEDPRVKPVAQAQSVVGLERKAGFPERALQDTVAYYNRFAREGQDPLLHKRAEFLAPLEKPPFVAWDLAVDKAFFPSHTFGGLHTDTHGRALDAWEDPIPGLYAAGRTSSGIPSAPYIASGVSVGDCSFFGRRAGRHLARGEVAG